MLTLIIAIAVATSVPAPKHTEVAPKQVAFVFDDQKAFYNLTDTKKKKRR